MREEEGQKFAGFHFSSILSDDIKATIKWASKIQNGNFSLKKEVKKSGGGGVISSVVGSITGGNGATTGGNGKDAPVETRDTADGETKYLSGGARELDGVRIEVESYSSPDL